MPQHSRKGDFVDLRFEMNAIVVLSTCQHRFDPNPKYAPVAVELECWRSGTAGKDDPCRWVWPKTAAASSSPNDTISEQMQTGAKEQS